MQRTINLTGDEFVEKLQGKDSFHAPSEHRYASYQAVAGGANIAWSIPSYRYFNSYPRHAWEFPEEDRERPDYLITTRVKLGGQSSILPSFGKKIDYFEYPCQVIVKFCTFKERLSIELLKTKYQLHFSNCIFENGILFNESDIHSIYFYECKFNSQSCDIHSITISNLKFHNCTEIESINIIVSI